MKMIHSTLKATRQDRIINLKKHENYECIDDNRRYIGSVVYRKHGRYAR